MTVHQPCVFCTIVGPDPQGQVIAHYAHSAMIEPLGPVTPGHRLFIPRRHVQDATEDPKVTAAVMLDVAAYARAVGPCNIITSVGADATQTIFHLHWHVVPRRHADGLTLPWTGQQASSGRH